MSARLPTSRLPQASREGSRPAAARTTSGARDRRTWASWLAPECPRRGGRPPSGEPSGRTAPAAAPPRSPCASASQLRSAATARRRPGGPPADRSTQLSPARRRALATAAAVFGDAARLRLAGPVFRRAAVRRHRARGRRRAPRGARKVCLGRRIRRRPTPRRSRARPRPGGAGHRPWRGGRRGSARAGRRRAAFERSPGGSPSLPRRKAEGIFAGSTQASRKPRLPGSPGRGESGFLHAGRVDFGEKREPTSARRVLAGHRQRIWPPQGRCHGAQAPTLRRPGRPRPGRLFFGAAGVPVWPGGTAQAAGAAGPAGVAEERTARQHEPIAMATAERPSRSNRPTIRGRLWRAGGRGDNLRIGAQQALEEFLRLAVDDPVHLGAQPAIGGDPLG